MPHWLGMRRMLLLACAVAVCGSIVVVAFAADSPIAERPGGPTPGGAEVPVPDSGPFALASSQARTQADADAERHRAAMAAYEARNQYDDHEHGDHSRRPGTGRRVRLIAGMAERLGVGRRTMWRAVLSVRRQISPREWSDARGEALRMLARELDRPFAEVERAVRRELRDEVSSHYGYVYRGGR